MGEVDMLSVKSEVEFDGVLIEHEEHASYLSPPVWDALPRAQESKENIKSDALSTAQNSTSRLVQLQSPLEDAGFSASPMCPAPLCRQFWKAGNYEDELVSKSQVQNSKNYLHVHPKFLHSNATSHKWAFGAIAELLDNAIDEIQNGASFVIVDKISNPRDGSPALLFQDDGGGMGPEAIRRCMSFGFSDKESKTAIGRYGNGFKTSTMRLGADAIVFSRNVGNRTFTQSIGLLSYIYLSWTGLNRVVVPMEMFYAVFEEAIHDVIVRIIYLGQGSVLPLVLWVAKVTTAGEIGLIIGPALGGLLAQPAEKYPEKFSKDSLFGRFPYFLPCLITSIFAVVVTVDNSLKGLTQSRERYSFAATIIVV